MRIIDRFGELLTYNPITVSWLTDNEKGVIWKNYLYNYSGTKEESPLLENYIFKETATPEKLTTLTSIIETMFNDKWNRLHDAIVLDYGVIDNYNRVEDTTLTTAGTNTSTSTLNGTEVMTGGHSGTNTGTDVMSGGHTETNTGTDVMSGGHTTDKTTDVQHKVSAYDSDTLVDNNSDMTNDVEELVYNSETKTINNSDSFTYNDETKTVNNSDSFTYNDETKTTNNTDIVNGTTSGTNTTHSEIKGNIGVTTSQQMIESEIELRKFNLINTMYNDIDAILSIGIYVY